MLRPINFNWEHEHVDKTLTLTVVCAFFLGIAVEHNKQLHITSCYERPVAVIKFIEWWIAAFSQNDADVNCVSAV